MLMNIMYYGMDNASNTGSDLQIGPYVNLTLQQVIVGIITNLIVFPPSLLLIQLFKRSKRRKTRLNILKTLLEKFNPNNSKIKEEKQNMKIWKSSEVLQ